MDQFDFEHLKADVHKTLLSRMDLEKLSTVQNGKARQAVAALVQEIVARDKVPLNSAERDKLQSGLLDEIFGLGPLEPLLADDTISDILVNRANLIYVERKGILEKVTARFRDDRHLLQIIDRIVAQVGRRIDESSPMVH